MASEQILAEKKAKVTELAQQLQECTSFVLVDYKGISVADDTALRKELREANVKYTVEKNSILRFAFKEMGIDAFDDVLHGTTAVAMSKDDQTAPARILGKYADEKPDYFTLKAGYVEGVPYDAEGVMKLSKIPSKDVLLAQLVGSLQGPIQKLAATLQALVEKKESEPEQEAPAEAPAEEAPVEAEATEAAPAEAAEPAPEA